MHLGVCDSKDDADGLLHFTEGKQVGTIVRLVRKERHTMNDTVFNLMSHSAAGLGLKGKIKKKKKKVQKNWGKWHRLTETCAYLTLCQSVF